MIRPYYKKDCYFVLAPSTVSWQCCVGSRLVAIPADNLWRVFSYHAGPEYGTLVYSYLSERPEANYGS